MRRFVLVRHATPESSGPEACLSARGREEAGALARRLEDWSFDAAWSSDLPRAVETAEAILAGRVLPSLQRSEALREVESPPREDWAAVDPAGYAAWEREATAGLAKRLEEWLLFSSGSIEGRIHPPLPLGEGRGEGSWPSATLVVCHAGPLRVLICLLLGLPPAAHWSFCLDRAGVTVIDRAEDLGTVLLLNDLCHLGQAG